MATEPTQEQVAVKEFMLSLGFLPTGVKSWVLFDPNASGEMLVNDWQATFFYRTCQAEVTKALDEVEAAAPEALNPDEWFNRDVRLHVESMNRVDAVWRQALAAQRAKYKPNEDKE